MTDIPAIDLLTGSPGAGAIIEGRAELAPLCSRWNEEVRGFGATLEGILTYR